MFWIRSDFGRRVPLTAAAAWVAAAATGLLADRTTWAADIGSDAPGPTTVVAADDASTPGEPAPRPDRHPELTRLSPTEDVWIDPVRKEVIVGGAIALDSGGIEVFACPEHSKEHEAVVAVRSSARMVHAALLAIGLNPGRPVSFDPDYAAAEGPIVQVRVRWNDDAGTVHDRPAKEWVRDTTTHKALDTDWVFAGSQFWMDPADGREYYQADGGDLICVSNFPTATLDLPIESSQANDALLFEAFAGRVPPRGTDVELVLSAGR
jgi:hypothetical protein